MDLAIRYMLVGLVMNFVGGWVTDFTTAYVAKQQGVTLSKNILIYRKSEIMSYKSIKVVKGNGGFGGPLVITPSEAKHKFIYITGGGEKPDNCG